MVYHGGKREIEKADNSEGCGDKYYKSFVLHRIVTYIIWSFYVRYAKVYFFLRTSLFLKKSARRKQAFMAINTFLKYYKPNGCMHNKRLRKVDVGACLTTQRKVEVKSYKSFFGENIDLLGNLSDFFLTNVAAIFTFQ